MRQGKETRPAWLTDLDLMIVRLSLTLPRSTMLESPRIVGAWRERVEAVPSHNSIRPVVFIEVYKTNTHCVFI